MTGDLSTRYGAKGRHDQPCSYLDDSMLAILSETTVTQFSIHQDLGHLPITQLVVSYGSACARMCNSTAYMKARQFVWINMLHIETDLEFLTSA
jgi:hypothetical protein